MIPPLLSTTGPLICLLVDGDKIELLLQVAKVIRVEGVHADDVCVRARVRDDCKDMSVFHDVYMASICVAYICTHMCVSDRACCAQ